MDVVIAYLVLFDLPQWERRGARRECGAGAVHLTTRLRGQTIGVMTSSMPSSALP
jgi:hypothetical protein